jgi:DNA-binding transcriptional regulator YhcF (GntR family)
VIVEIDPSSSIPPYEQIRAQIATMIGSGVLPPDARLPPIRQLAADLGLATNTVARAYRELEAEGLVASRVRHGTRVTPNRKPAARAERRQRLGAAARAYLAVAYQLGLSAEDAAQALRAAADNG